MSASKLCPCCRHPIKRNDESIQCIGMCKKTYHVGCARLSPEEYSNFLSLNGELKWMCHSCNCSFKQDATKSLTKDLSGNKSMESIFNKNEDYEVYTATRYKINEDGQKKSLENIVQMMDSSEVLISKYRKEVGKKNSNDGEMIVQKVTNRREIRTKIISPSMEFFDKEKQIKFAQDHDKKTIDEPSEIKAKKSKSLIFKKKSEDLRKNKLKSIQEKNTLHLLECDSGESVLLHVKNTSNDEQYVECCQFIKPDVKHSDKKFPQLLKILHNIESDSREKIKIQDRTSEKVLLSVSNDENIKNNETIKRTEETLDEIKEIPDIDKLSSEQIENETNNESSLSTLFAQKNSLVVSTDHMDHKNTGHKRDRIKKQKPLKNKIPSNTLLIEDLIQNVSNVPTQSKKGHSKPNSTSPSEFFVNKSEDNFSNHEQGYNSSISTIIDLNPNDSQKFDEICSRKCIEWKSIVENKSKNVPLKSIIKVKEDNEKITPQKSILCNKVTIKEMIGGFDSPQFQSDLDSLKSKSKSNSQVKIKMKPTENLNLRKSKSKTPDKKDLKPIDPLIFDKEKEEKPAVKITFKTTPILFSKEKEKKPPVNMTEGPARTIVINKNEIKLPYEPSYIEIIKQLLGMGPERTFDQETEIDNDIQPSSANASNQYNYKIPCSSKSMNTTIKMCPHYERDTQFPEDDILEEDEETQKARELVKGLNKCQVEKIRNGDLIRISSKKSSPIAQLSPKSSPAKETK